jgi:YesN/AraC family two-component response regulator
MAHILLVDDEPLVVEALSSAMISKGHRVVTATNGSEGMERFAEATFDLVITDIIMPDKEGIEMIMEMRRQAPNTRIVAISGGGRTGNVEFLQMAKKLGAMTTLKKPIRLAELYTMLEQCLGKSPGT